jgi:hypothetical protein
MKIVILTIIIVVALPLLATEVSLELIDYFGFSQYFTSGQEHIVVDFPFMYALTINSVQIFEINENGSLDRLKVMPFKRPTTILKNQDYLYVVTGGTPYAQFDFVEPATIFQIDVSNPANPIIVNSIAPDFPYNYSTVYGNIIGGYIQVYDRLENSKIYSLPELEFVTTLPQSPSTQYYIVLQELTDDIAIHISMPHNTLCFYDYSDINNIQYLDEIDMSAIHNLSSSITYFTKYSEDIVLVNNQYAISFWDITNPAAWQYLTHYEFEDILVAYSDKAYSMIDDNLLVLMKYNGLELLDISDIYNPQVLDTFIIPAMFIRQNSVYNDYIYTTLTDFNHIFKLDRDQMQIEFQDIHIDYPMNRAGSKVYDNYLILLSDWFLTPFESCGVYFYDISNPEEPQIIFNELYEKEYESMNLKDDLLIVAEQNESTVEIYDISILPEVELLSQISTEPLVNGKILVDDYEDDAFYLYKHYPNSILRKYDISDPQNPELLFEFEHPVGYTMLIHNGYGYLYESNEAQNTQTLYVIEGLHDNVPQIVEIYPHFVNHAYASPIMVDEYLLHQYNETILDHFYSLAIPTEPTVQFSIMTGLAFQLQNASIYDNLLFITESKISPVQLVYDIGDDPSGVYNLDEYIFGHQLLNRSSYIHFYENNSRTFLFNIRRYSNALYELEITPISADEPAILPPEVSFANFPNPFNTETTFAINLPQIDDDAVIELYNIKGQLIRKLEVSLSEESVTHITWDGRDNRGRVIASGIYLAKLRNGSETLTHRVVMLK